MKRKAPTKKEIDQALAGLSMNDQILADKMFHHETILSLILEHDKKLDKFVKQRIEEIARSRSENKEGA